MCGSYSVATPRAAGGDSILCPCPRSHLSSILCAAPRRSLDPGLKQAGQPSDLNHLLILVISGFDIGSISAKRLHLGALCKVSPSPCLFLLCRYSQPSPLKPGCSLFRSGQANPMALSYPLFSPAAHLLRLLAPAPLHCLP